MGIEKVKFNKIKYIILLFIFSIASLILVLLTKYDNTSDLILSELKNNIDVLDIYLNKHNFPSNGGVKVNAKYRGAHGENYPHEFLYDYNIQENNITFISNDGISKIKIDDSLYNIVDYLKSVDLNTIFKYTKKSRNKIYIDEVNFNNKMKTSYKNIYIKIKDKNNYKIILDKDYIDISSDINKCAITSKIDNNDITFSLNKIGFNLNINDNLKINAFFNNNTSYSIVLNNKVYYLELNGEEIKFNASSESQIYNGIELTRTNDKNNFYSKKEDLNNPIERYFKDIDLGFWGE